LESSVLASMTVFERLSNTTLREQISTKIKDAILAGSLREGERLVERALAAQFETSLTAVREALVQLETEGFVTKKTNSATHVSKFSLEATEKIFKVRRLLETYAVEEAARHATPQQLRELEETYLELLDTARAQEVLQYQFKDLALHVKIWELSGNEYLQIALKRTVHPMFAVASIRLVSCYPFDLIQDTYLHLPIIEAIKRKDPAGAGQAFLEALDHWTAEHQAMASPTVDR
jgi:DNA-binding GntR family transcriptional regulator